MEIIAGIIIGVFAIVGTVILVRANRKNKVKGQNIKEGNVPATDCCGAHEVCEFDQIKADETIIEYYDDEELDEFKNINSNAYSSGQIDQFREVLYTLKTSEIRYWLLSIERRNINLPAILVSEARTLMAEA